MQVTDIGLDDQDGGSVNLTNWFIINSDSKWYSFWKFLIIILQFSSSYMYALLAAYRDYTWVSIWVPIECVFFVDMVSNCFTDFKDEYEKKVRDIFIIAPRYIAGPFFMDFVPLIPFQLMQLQNNIQNLFFVIKLMRIVRGYGFISINELMIMAKKSLDKIMTWKIEIDNGSLSLEQRLESDEMLPSDPAYDYIKILQLMLISYAMKTSKLFFFILSFSFFSAMFFRMFLEIEHDLYGPEGMNNDYYLNNGDCSNDGAEGFFRLCYGLEDLPM